MSPGEHAPAGVHEPQVAVEIRESNLQATGEMTAYQEAVQNTDSEQHLLKSPLGDTKDRLYYKSPLSSQQHDDAAHMGDGHKAVDPLGFDHRGSSEAYGAGPVSQTIDSAQQPMSRIMAGTAPMPFLNPPHAKTPMVDSSGQPLLLTMPVDGGQELAQTLDSKDG